MNNGLQFNLKEGQVIRKVKCLNNVGLEDVQKHMTWSALKVLNHMNLLPKGYFTRVYKGNISYETARRKAKEIMFYQTDYEIVAREYNGKTYMALLEQIYHNPEQSN